MVIRALSIFILLTTTSQTTLVLHSQSDGAVRPLAYEGAAYEANRTIFGQQIDEWMRVVSSEASVVASSDRPLAVIVPHATLAACGRVTAAAFTERHLPRTFTRVVLIGPSHERLLATPVASGFSRYETPFGEMDVDVEAVASLVTSRQWVTADVTCELFEHSLENVVPFVARVCASCKLVPLLTSEPKPIGDSLPSTLIPYITSNDTLIVISTDFSHLSNNTSDPEGTVRRLDQPILDAIISMNPLLFRKAVSASGETMCGDGAVALLLDALTGLPVDSHAQLLAYRVGQPANGYYVGCAAFAFYHRS